jgi:hypothetical protein
VTRRRRTSALALLAALAGLAAASAQELEPRAYSASPVGANFVVAALTRSSGDVVTDPALPLSNVEARVGAFALGYGRTFDLLGQQALATVALPYAWGRVEGDVGTETRRVTRSGLADLKARFSVNLIGNPARSREAFAATRERRILLGASLAISAPTGQYDPTRLVNLGTNRWALKPEVGVSVPWGKFDFEAYGGAIFFTRNSAFYPGTVVRDQSPLGVLQAHVAYTFRPNLWLAADATWYAGGATTLNGGPPTARQENTRIGGTLSVPVGRRQSVKLGYSNGVAVRVGQRFETIGLSWQYLWF